MNIQELAEEKAFEIAAQYGYVNLSLEEGKRILEVLRRAFVAGAQSSASVPSVGIVEEMARVLYSNKSDESDEGSWIVAEDYYKIASLCAAIAQKHIQEEAVAFAEWLSINNWHRYGDYWFNPPANKHSTKQLYAIYQQSK